MPGYVFKTHSLPPHRRYGDFKYEEANRLYHVGNFTGFMRWLQYAAKPACSVVQRAIETGAIARGTVTGLALMERAGQGVVTQRMPLSRVAHTGL